MLAQPVEQVSSQGVPMDLGKGPFLGWIQRRGRSARWDRDRQVGDGGGEHWAIKMSTWWASTVGAGSCKCNQYFKLSQGLVQMQYPWVWPSTSMQSTSIIGLSSFEEHELRSTVQHSAEHYNTNSSVQSTPGELNIVGAHCSSFGGIILLHLQAMILKRDISSTILLSSNYCNISFAIVLEG